MAVLDRNNLEYQKPRLDLKGPEGNAFVLLGHARAYAKQLGMDVEAITQEMQADDYDNLVNVFDKYFGDYVDLVR